MIDRRQACRLLAGAGLSRSAAPSRPADLPQRGRIALPGVTGAAPIGGGRVLLTCEGPNGVAVVEGLPERLASGQIEAGPGGRLRESLRDRIDLESIQDAAWDGKDAVYLAASHARTPRGDAPDARYRLARLRLDAGGRLLEARQSGALLEAFVSRIPFLGDSIRRPPARAGLNVEGLAWDPRGLLLVGLRSPTVTESRPRTHGGQEDAVVVRIANAEALFGDAPAPAEPGEVVKLDLHGQGIRGMACDAASRSFWLLSGLSVAPTHPVRSPWALWRWDGAGEPRRMSLPETMLDAPAAVCPLEDGRLLLVEPADPESRWAVVGPL